AAGQRLISLLKRILAADIPRIRKELLIMSTVIGYSSISGSLIWQVSEGTGGGGALSSPWRLSNDAMESRPGASSRISRRVRNAPWSRILSDLVSQLTLLDHAYVRFEKPFLATVSGVTSTMSVRITAIAGVMQEGSGEGVMSSRNFCRGNSFRRLREAAFLEEVEGLHTLIVNNLKKILSDEQDPVELAVIEQRDDLCMFAEDRIAVRKIVAVEVEQQWRKHGLCVSSILPPSRYSPAMLDVLLEQRKLALADITVKHFDVSVIDTARCMQEAPDEIVAQYSGAVPPDAIHHFCRIAGSLLTSYEALLSEVSHLCDESASADNGTTSPQFRALAQCSNGGERCIHPSILFNEELCTRVLEFGINYNCGALMLTEEMMKGAQRQILFSKPHGLDDSSFSLLQPGRREMLRRAIARATKKTGALDVGELVREAPEKINAKHSSGHSITAHHCVRSGNPQHNKKTRTRSQAAEIESIDSGIEADSSSVNSDDACYFFHSQERVKVF
ncbi:hypothetical protein FOZ63_001295, partial [Perkinsus olseni]